MEEKSTQDQELELKAVTLIRKLLPDQFPEGTEYSTTKFESYTSHILLVATDSLKVVYKEKTETFFDQFLKVPAFYKSATDALIKTSYGTGLIYVSEDLTVCLEYYFEGVRPKKEIFTEEQIPEFLKIAAKEIAVFQTALQSSYPKDDKVYLNVYNDILVNRGGEAFFRKLLAGDTICPEFKSGLQIALDFLTSEEVTKFNASINSGTRRFLMSHNDLHWKNILFNRNESKAVIVDFEDSYPNMIYFDLAFLLLFYEVEYLSDPIVGYRFSGEKYLTDDFLKVLLKIYLDNLKIDGLELGDVDTEFKHLVEALKLASLLPVTITGVIMALVKEYTYDWPSYATVGIDFYKHWSAKLETL